MEDEKRLLVQTCVWSWGAGNHGQLASGTFRDSWIPVSVPSLTFVVEVLAESASGAGIRNLACGGAHGLAVVEKGEVVSWGRGQSGALGHGDEINLNIPKMVRMLQGIRIQSVAAGWSHSALVTEYGELYTCGSGSFGQLGHGDLEARLLPFKVEALSHLHVTMAACGMRHTLVLINEGFGAGPNSTSVYAFGSCKRGQLGTDPAVELDSSVQAPKKLVCKAVPERVAVLNEVGVVTLAANGDHSAAVSGTGSLYVWGKGFNQTSDTHVPSPTGGNLQFSQVSLGWSHGLALTDNGSVWGWGSNCRGQLGILQEPDTLLKSTDRKVDGGLQLVRGFEGKRAISVSAGAEHSAVVLEDGTIMVWGWAEHGQLGLRTLCDQAYPQKVVIDTHGMSQDSACSWQACCGSGFTFAIAQWFYRSS